MSTFVSTTKQGFASELERKIAGLEGSTDSNGEKKAKAIVLKQDVKTKMVELVSDTDADANAALALLFARLKTLSELPDDPEPPKKAKPEVVDDELDDDELDDELDEDDDDEDDDESARRSTNRSAKASDSELSLEQKLSALKVEMAELATKRKTALDTAVKAAVKKATKAVDNEFREKADKLADRMDDLVEEQEKAEKRRARRAKYYGKDNIRNTVFLGDDDSDDNGNANPAASIGKKILGWLKG